ncbi:MAG: RagB/SusD family nutrient uptake outer membrane protein [Saprospiraceae bacterium]|nr:RagB/SusD family nutrient uptake outer membrane protein [Saprospiraceae bacterium]
MMQLKNIKLYLLAMLFALAGWTGCTIDDVPDPNNPSLAPILEDATLNELRALALGVEQLGRDEIGFYYDVTSILGRDYWFFTSSDPRYTGELLGKGSAVLDDAGFYGTRPYAGRYANVKQCNIIIEAVANSKADLSAAERLGFTAFANTMKAYELLLALNLQYQNGIRTDVADPDNLGAFQSYENALRDINELLETAANDLNNAGDEFAFSLSPGFAGFDTPATFRQFTRAVQARVALYRNDKASALSHLNESFFDLAGDFQMGPSRYYTTAGGEELNPVFRTPDQSEAIVAHPDFVLSLDPADARNAKIAMRPSGAISLDGLTGDHDVVLWNSQSTPISYISNEELILIYAESNIGTNNTEAISALDVIRTGNGLGAYAGGSDDDSVTDEMLDQRRWSLFGQGHRWVDMRRYNRLDELTIDRPDDDVWTQLPRPVSEN